MVFQLLDKNGLCDYYALNENPGITLKKPARRNKFAFLDDEKIFRQLVQFADENQVHITQHLPQMHCSSCLYLLENLHKINAGVISSTVNFPRKEVTVVYSRKELTLRGLAELLTSVGYEPYISLNDLNGKKPVIDRSLLYQLGIAGFCFSNIMLLSFPEYLGLDKGDEQLGLIFRYMNLVLSLPVFFYSARPFFESGYKALKHKFLNIDAPIALAILVTFGRSVYEILTDTGAGYLDSMAGIVFFMLIGRVLQEKTYAHLSFERDFRAYFPIAVAVVKEDKEVPTSLPDIRNGDTLRIHHEELIPADSIITRGKAYIDYSFVTGESVPVSKEMGEIVYAGGRQTGGMIEVLVIREVSQSYLTKLWSDSDRDKAADTLNKTSFVHLLSRYFTLIVFTIATIAAIYWALNNPANIFPSVTAVLIIACPCALLLSNTFTNGHIINILGRNKLFVRNAGVIEQISKTTHIVFDKTGTLTDPSRQDVTYNGIPLTETLKESIAAVMVQSAHPLSKAVFASLNTTGRAAVKDFREFTGKGVCGKVWENNIRLGSAEFTGLNEVNGNGTAVHLRINDQYYGKFTIRNHYREGVTELIKTLSPYYNISVISGDNPSEQPVLEQLLGPQVQLHFNQQPEDKLRFVRQLQQDGGKVMMIGDGLNDAGALRESHTGIALTDDSGYFTPASDGIMEATALPKLQGFIRLCTANRKIVIASFIVSILYNIAGIYFAVQALLSPLVAAILMPASSISIMLLTYSASKLTAHREFGIDKNHFPL